MKVIAHVALKKKTGNEIYNASFYRKKKNFKYSILESVSTTLLFTINTIFCFEVTFQTLLGIDKYVKKVSSSPP